MNRALSPVASALVARGQVTVSLRRAACAQARGSASSPVTVQPLVSPWLLWPSLLFLIFISFTPKVLSSLGWLSFPPDRLWSAVVRCVLHLRPQLCVAPATVSARDEEKGLPACLHFGRIALMAGHQGTDHAACVCWPWLGRVFSGRFMVS